jgi:hypothetical protein
MSQIPKEMKALLFGKGAKWHARIAMVLGCLGMVCLVLGIISAALNRPLVLGSTNWLLLTISFVVWALWAWLCAYFAIKEE